MKGLYISTKTVTAWPAEHLHQPGYAVSYSDGYIGWAPKEVFERDHRRLQGLDQALTFGDALHMLMLGKTVRREGWVTKGANLFLARGSHDFMSTPDVVPGLIGGVDNELFDNGHTGTVTRMPCICIELASGEHVMGWQPFLVDMLASDWSVVNGGV